MSVREDITRLKILGGIQDYMIAGEGLVKIRERLAKELANYRERIEREISTRRFQIKATEMKLKSLGHAVGEGTDLSTLKNTIVELEAHKAHQEAELDSFIKASSAPRWQLPAVKELEALMANLDTHLNSNPELGRAMLRRWLNDGLIKMDETSDGEVVADIELMPGRIVIEVPVRSQNRKGKSPEVGSDLRANPLFSQTISGSGGEICQCIYRVFCGFVLVARQDGRVIVMLDWGAFFRSRPPSGMVAESCRVQRAASLARASARCALRSKYAPIDRMPCAIQFAHPGGEPNLRPPSKPWALTSTPHTRAFIEARGVAVGSSSDSERSERSLHFWGEWEADANVAMIETPNGARCVQHPALVPRSSFIGLHNTDPYVFDGPFLYSNCRQKGVLLRLARGSVIVFGSTVGGRFLLDTVFVVSKRVRDYAARDAVALLQGCSVASFVHATAQPIQASARKTGPGCVPNDARFVLYEGGTLEAPVDGMFSFSPSLPAPSFFSRPEVSIAGLNPDSARNIRIIYPPPPEPIHTGIAGRVRAIWEALVQQVTAQGLLLGVKFEIGPPTIGSATGAQRPKASRR